MRENENIEFEIVRAETSAFKGRLSAISKVVGAEKKKNLGGLSYTIKQILVGGEFSYNEATGEYCQVYSETFLQIEINSLDVEKEFQKRGIGSALLGAAIDYSRTRGCKDVSIPVETKPIDATPFYEKFFDKRNVDFAKHQTGGASSIRNYTIPLEDISEQKQNEEEYCRRPSI